MKKNISLLVLLSALFANLYAQEILSNFNTNWTSVLPGTAISEPAVTSYGFCLAPAEQRDRFAIRARGVRRRGARTGKSCTPAEYCSCSGRRTQACRCREGRTQRYRFHARTGTAGQSAGWNIVCQRTRVESQHPPHRGQPLAGTRDGTLRSPCS